MMHNQNIDKNNIKINIKTRLNLNCRQYSYIFDKFENWGSKEKTNIQNYTIEHIMP